MTVETILDLRADLLTTADDAMAILRDAWEECERPTDTPALITVLKLTMDRCGRRGIVYPRIFLLRKAELRRGEFQPRREMRSAVDPRKLKFAATGNPGIPHEWIEKANVESAWLAQEKFARHQQERAKWRSLIGTAKS